MIAGPHNNQNSIEGIDVTEAVQPIDNYLPPESINSLNTSVRQITDDVNTITDAAYSDLAMEVASMWDGTVPHDDHDDTIEGGPVQPATSRPESPELPGDNGDGSDHTDEGIECGNVVDEIPGSQELTPQQIQDRLDQEIRTAQIARMNMRVNALHTYLDDQTAQISAMVDSNGTVVSAIMELNGVTVDLEAIRMHNGETSATLRTGFDITNNLQARAMAVMNDLVAGGGVGLRGTMVLYDAKIDTDHNDTNDIHTYVEGYADVESSGGVVHETQMGFMNNALAFGIQAGYTNDNTGTDVRISGGYNLQHTAAGDSHFVDHVLYAEASLQQQLAQNTSLSADVEGSYALNGNYNAAGRVGVVQSRERMRGGLHVMAHTDNDSTTVGVEGDMSYKFDNTTVGATAGYEYTRHDQQAAGAYYIDMSAQHQIRDNLSGFVSAGFHQNNGANVGLGMNWTID